jgi:uncharacterized protein
LKKRKKVKQLCKEVPMQSFTNPGHDGLKAILQQTKSIAVVGLSDKPARASHRVAAYMQAMGYRIIPVNPVIKETLGEKAFASIDELVETPDMVCIFRRSEEVPPLVDAAIKKGASIIWMQDHVMHTESAQRALDAGLQVVMNDCVLRRHQQLIGVK